MLNALWKKEEKEIQKEENVQETAQNAECNAEECQCNEVPADEQCECIEDKLQKEIDELKDKHLRLSAEFDNYRRRTVKEKMDLVKSGGEDVLKKILPIVDDFDRAVSHLSEVKDAEAVKAGIMLIYNKFQNFVNTSGLQVIDAKEKDFDTDLHEALTKIPAPSEDLKGKIVDVIQKGYYLNDKVIRFAKVVVGE